MASFDEQYKKLNPKQREAVDSTDGPVLVIAGPGTGKTQLLSMRVANIIRKSQADPSNILCLTFTNKAAVNMRDRLLSLVGTESNKVTVKTFHGFSAGLMNNYPDYFWSGAKLSIAPDALQLEIVQNILRQLPLSNPLSIKFAGQFTATDDVIAALRLAKEAGLTPEKLRAILDANLAYIDIIEPILTDLLSEALSYKNLGNLQAAIAKLPQQGIDTSIAPLLSLTSVIQESLEAAIKADSGSNKTQNVGKWKARWLQTQNGQKGMFDERRRNNWWLAFADVYQIYRNNLHQRGYYDYSDMLLEVIVQLEQNPDLLAGVQERYQYVLIDEFQDSNAAQLRLAHLIADHHTSEGQPYLMAVGDDDQSIYGFNGAELNNMLFFERNYNNVKVVVLEDNYRSSQNLLDTSEKIIEQADDRLVKRLPGLSKKLVAKNPPKNIGLVEHFAYKTREHQYSDIARKIKHNYESSSDKIAVLARGHESLRQISSILNMFDVPIRYEQQNNIFDNVVVKQIILLAETVNAIIAGDKEVVNQKLSRLIRYPAWKFSGQELWEIATQNYKDPDWLNSLTQSKHTKHKQLGDWLQWLASETSLQQLPIALEYFLGLTAGKHMTSPLKEYYLTKKNIDNNYLNCLSATKLLQELIVEFSNNEDASLENFINFVNLNKENGRRVTDQSVFISQPDAVELYTVHKAKGLEFDQVFIIDAVDDNWKPRKVGRRPPANLPLQPPGEQADDYIRLLYVAATRAKYTLIVSSYLYDHNGNEVLTSPYIKNSLPDSNQKEVNIPEVQVLEESLSWPRLEIKDEKSLLKSRLENYRLSPTHLLNFLDVTNGGPQYFFERHVLRLPESKTAMQGYGNAIHSTLQYVQQLYNKDSLNLKKVLNRYNAALEQEHLNHVDHEKYLTHGKEILQKLLNQDLLDLKIGGLTEEYMSDIKIGDANVGGGIDRIDQIDDTLLITDYKTGTPLNNFTTRDKTKAVKAWRHRSQLIFYLLLVKNNPRFSGMADTTVRMMYLEAERGQDIIKLYHPSELEINHIQSLIESVWNKVINLDFPDTSNYSSNIEGIRSFEDDLIKK